MAEEQKDGEGAVPEKGAAPVIHVGEAHMVVEVTPPEDDEKDDE